MLHGGSQNTGSMQPASQYAHGSPPLYDRYQVVKLHKATQRRRGGYSFRWMGPRGDKELGHSWVPARVEGLSRTPTEFGTDLRR